MLKDLPLYSPSLMLRVGVRLRAARHERQYWLLFVFAWFAYLTTGPPSSRDANAENQRLCSVCRRVSMVLVATRSGGLAMLARSTG
jgi:hypothetical protein